MISPRLLWILYLVILPVSWVRAAVVRVELASRQDVLGGQHFGQAGAYERMTGKVFFSAAISNSHNLRIVDLENAVNLENGSVEFSADFIALCPKDSKKGNGSMILENPNRGRATIVAQVDGGDGDVARSAGDGWLLRNGYSVVTLGWQWDAPGESALKLYAPIARDHGQTITGLLRGDLMPWKQMEEIPMGHLIVGSMGGSEYAVANEKDARNTLTVRDTRNAPRKVIARDQWRFAHQVNGKFIPSDRHIQLDGGFQKGRIYEYIYAVADPVVAGLGFAAVRDFASYAKHSREALVPAVRVYGQGISQNGRFLRDFVYQGFNADEEGRKALDGILAHAAGAGRGNFNYRFAQPSRDAQPTSALGYPTDIFPFTDLPETDPLTGAVSGLLDAAMKEQVTPKIFYSNTSYEYWGRAASLISTTADGKGDAPAAGGTRIYHFTGLQHFTGPFPAARGSGDLLGQQPESPLPSRYFWRAMIRNMDAWVREEKLPPASSHPRIADHTLTPLNKYAFPKIGKINKPHEVSSAPRLSFGPDWERGIVSQQPPLEGKPYVTLVPQVDEDGNERDGIRLPEIAVPLATYTGWNLRDPSIGAAGERVAFEGSFIPFARTREQRKANRDPRKSIEERHASREEYLKSFQAALEKLVKEGWILEEDRAAVMHRGEEEWEEAMKPESAQKQGSQ